MKTQKTKYYQSNPTKPLVLGILSVVLFLPGIMLMVYDNSYIGISFIIFYFLIATHRKGIELNVESKKFRLFHQLVLFRFGKWLPINGYQSYQVVNKNLSYSLNSRGSTSATYTDHNYDIILEASNAETRDICATFSKKHIHDIQQSLSLLGLRKNI